MTVKPHDLITVKPYNRKYMYCEKDGTHGHRFIMRERVKNVTKNSQRRHYPYWCNVYHLSLRQPNAARHHLFSTPQR